MIVRVHGHLDVEVGDSMNEDVAREAIARVFSHESPRDPVGDAKLQFGFVYQPKYTGPNDKRGATATVRGFVLNRAASRIVRGGRFVEVI